MTPVVYRLIRTFLYTAFRLAAGRTALTTLAARRAVKLYQPVNHLRKLRGAAVANHCFGAGANGAGAGTFLLIKASSFCLSVVEPLAPAVESVFFGGSGAGVAIG